MQLINDMRHYTPFNEQEQVDQQVILTLLESNPQAFVRKSLAHLTCSVWTVDPMKTKTLMVYHRIYNSWSWIGGHADGNTNLASVALKELQEETGVANARLVPLEAGNIFSIEMLTVNGHIKQESYLSSHLHANVTFLAVASPHEQICIKADENSAVAWIDLTKVCEVSTEPWMCEHVYRKFIAKLASIKLA